MKTLKESVELKQLGTITPMRVPLTLEDRGESICQPPSLGYYRDYKVEARICCTFSANEAMLETQVRDAKRHILETMFLDVRKHLHNLRMLVRGGYTDDALKIIEQIDDATTADRS